MKILLNSLLILGLINFALMTSVHAESESFERVIWTKKPISVQLSVGKERMIEFPADVRFWLPDGMERMATVLSTAGVLYIHAHKPFPSTRIRVQNLENQTVYLIDVFANLETGFLEKIVVTADLSQRDLSELPGSVTILNEDIILPEAFSPNGDGINDTFGIEFIDVVFPNFSLEKS